MAIRCPKAIEIRKLWRRARPHIGKEQTIAVFNGVDRPGGVELDVFCIGVKCGRLLWRCNPRRQNQLPGVVAHQRQSLSQQVHGHKVPVCQFFGQCRWLPVTAQHRARWRVGADPRYPVVQVLTDHVVVPFLCSLAGGWPSPI